MKVLTKKNLKNLKSNTIYRGCIFYLDENTEYRIQNSIFEHCSFRCDFLCSDLQGCQFDNCGFSGNFELDLSNQGLREIPTYVFSLTDLTGLYFIGNSLEHIPKEIKNLSKLRELSFQANNFKSIEEEVFYLPNLEYLNLSENKLEKIPDKIKKINLKTEILLFSNPISRKEQEKIIKFFPNNRIDF